MLTLTFDKKAHEELVSLRNNLILSLMELKGYVPYGYQDNRKILSKEKISTKGINYESEAKMLNEILYISVLLEEENKYKFP